MRRYKLSFINILLWISLGVMLSILLFISFILLQLGARSNQTIDCFDISNTSSQYCVYYSGTPGIFGDSKQLVIGVSSDRGLVYTVPYSSKDITAALEPGSEDITITMPGTELRIERSEYIDNR